MPVSAEILDKINKRIKAVESGLSTAIDLHNNQIGYYGAKALAEGLGVANLPALNYINLYSNQIGDDVQDTIDHCIEPISKANVLRNNKAEEQAKDCVGGRWNDLPESAQQAMIAGTIWSMIPIAEQPDFFIDMSARLGSSNAEIELNMQEVQLSGE